jgi:hypothetical protein
LGRRTRDALYGARGTAALLATTKGRAKMKVWVAKRFAPAVVALGVAVGGLGLTAGTSFASTHSHADAVKAGAACTRKELNKTKKVGKEDLVCKKVDGKYKWEKKK